MTTRAGHLINRTNTLPSFAYGTESMLADQGQRPLHNGEQHDGTSSIYKYWAIHEEYMDEETEAFNKKGRDDLSELKK